MADGHFQVAAGTVYPILHKLESEGLVTSSWQSSDSGPRRKYYILTQAGASAIETEKRQWLRVHQLFLKLWGLDLSPLRSKDVSYKGFDLDAAVSAWRRRYEADQAFTSDGLEELEPHCSALRRSLS